MPPATISEFPPFNVVAILRFPPPSKVPLPVTSPYNDMVLVVASLVAVSALPVRSAFIVSGRLRTTLLPPLKETALPAFYNGLISAGCETKLLVRLCRMLHRLPDEIRAVDVNDFQLLFDDSMTVPYIDEAFYYAFGGGGAKKDKLSLSGPSTKEERRKVIQEIIKKKG